MANNERGGQNVVVAKRGLDAIPADRSRDVEGSRSLFDPLFATREIAEPKELLLAKERNPDPTAATRSLT